VFSNIIHVSKVFAVSFFIPNGYPKCTNVKNIILDLIAVLNKPKKKKYGKGFSVGGG